jgi:hypothetical protein
MILSPQPEFFLQQEFQDEGVQPMQARRGFRAWTDDYSGIVAISKGVPDWVRKVVP